MDKPKRTWAEIVEEDHRTHQGCYAGEGKRKKRVTFCFSCRSQGRDTPADFCHLSWAPATDYGPMGLCWPCYETQREELLNAYRDIVRLVGEIEDLSRQIPPDELRTIRPSPRSEGTPLR